jgi:archaemetzincin
MIWIKVYLMQNVFFTMAIIFMMACGSRPELPVVSGGQLEKKIPVQKTLIIALQPFGELDTSLVSFAAKEIKDFYHFKVVWLETASLPEMAWYAPRSRYRADSLLIWLEAKKPDSVDHIMGLTDQDISCTKEQYPDWGIFGYGYQPGPSCVISTFRLKRNHAPDELFRERFAKVLLHELGHNLGLPHCPTRGCMMEDANGTMVTVDNEKKELCPLCRTILNSH